MKPDLYICQNLLAIVYSGGRKVEEDSTLTLLLLVVALIIFTGLIIYAWVSSSKKGGCANFDPRTFDRGEDKVAEGDYEDRE